MYRVKILFGISARKKLASAKMEALKSLPLWKLHHDRINKGTTSWMMNDLG